MRTILFLIIILLPMRINAQQFDWQGHRGARGLMPENSIPAFREALEIGVTTLELDVVISADHQVVVSHEPWFSPLICLTPSGGRISREEARKYNLYQLDYDSIRLFDCGSIGHPGFPDQKKMKVHKPLLDKVLVMAEKYCKDEMRDEIYYNIEIKSRPGWDNIFHPGISDFGDLVYHTIDAYIPWERVTIQSFDFRVLKYFHETYPEVRLAALIESEKKPEKVLDILGFKPAIYSPYYKLIKPSKVKILHDMDIRVIPWTVNSTHDMRNLIDMGVDGIITDYPNRIAETGLE